MAVRRRPSYGFDLAGEAFGFRPEVGVSKRALSQLFPELGLATDFTKETQPEEVEKDETIKIKTPTTETDYFRDTQLSSDKRSQRPSFRSEYTEKSSRYAPPLSERYTTTTQQVSPSGPQGRGASKLGYTPSVASSASPNVPAPITPPTPQTSPSTPPTSTPEYYAQVPAPPLTPTPTPSPAPPAEQPRRLSLDDISHKYGQFSTFGHRDYQAARDEGYSDAEILNYLNEDMRRLHPDNRPGGSAGLYEEIMRGSVDYSKAVNIVR